MRGQCLEHICNLICSVHCVECSSIKCVHLRTCALLEKRLEFAGVRCWVHVLWLALMRLGKKVLVTIFKSPNFYKIFADLLFSLTLPAAHFKEVAILQQNVLNKTLGEIKKC